MVKKLALLLCLFGFFAQQVKAATLDGGPPPFGSSVNEIRNDDVLEKAELYKRGLIRVTATGINTIALTSISVPFTVLSDGLETSFVDANTTTATT